MPNGSNLKETWWKYYLVFYDKDIVKCPLLYHYIKKKNNPAILEMLSCPSLMMLYWRFLSVQVKQILDRPRCQTLAEGDLLHKINGIDVRNMTHAQIVQVLKDCPIGAETQIIVQRGGEFLSCLDSLSVRGVLKIYPLALWNIRNQVPVYIIWFLSDNLHCYKCSFLVWIPKFMV